MSIIVLGSVVIFVTYVKASLPIPQTIDRQRVDPDDPRSDSDSVNKIVGGTQVPIEQYPYMVSLQTRNQHICGGSILNFKTVLTAAHCVSGSNQGFSVRVGSRDWATGGQTAIVSKIVIHPSYNKGVQSDNDVAIIKLSTNLVLNNQVRAVSLASTRPADNAVCTVSGWGQTTSGAYPRLLNAVNVNVISQGQCINTYGNGRITDRMICATAKNQNACFGDSGGPLVSNGLQVGIVSWGSRCGTTPAVYSSVPVLRSFINNNL